MPTAASQRERFIAGEGDAWFARNRDVLEDNQTSCPVLDVVLRLDPRPSRVLQVGCANGWRMCPDSQLAVACLVKNTRIAWPANPWRDEAS